jgi:glycosyltransferase involved in cell wall biosynthesis
MRILHTIRTLNPAWGGPVHGLRSMMSAAKRAGMKTEVVCLDSPQADWLVSWDVPVHALGPVKSRYGYSRALDEWLAEHVKCFDAVIVEGIWMYFSLATWRAASKYKVPYYVFTHGALHPWFKRYPLKEIKKALYWRLFEHKVIRDAAAVLFTTEDEKIESHNSFLPYRCNPVVIGYGIAPPPPNNGSAKHEIVRAFTATYPSLRNRPYLLFLGRVTEKKGIDLLIEALSKVKHRLSSTALVVAGPGDRKYLDHLKNLASKLAVDDDIVWAGPVYDGTKWSLLRGSEALVLPSHQENFGVNVTEALACGIPVLISDKVNIWPEVDRARAGFVETDDVLGTVNLLSRWHSLSASDKQAMSLRASDCFAANFHISRTSSRLFDLLRSLSRHEKATHAVAGI